VLAGQLQASCPFCGPVGLTLSEQYEKADAAVLAGWVSADIKTETTTFEIVQIARDESAGLKQRERITVKVYREGQSGNLFFLTGAGEKRTKWDRPIEVTEIG